jgi:Leucine-rich repeat (LRR) protein
VKRVSPLFTLDFSDHDMTGTGLKELANFTQLSALNFSYTGVTDAALKGTANLAQLTKLDLTSTPVTDAGLKELANLTQLTKLSLAKTKVTDAGLKEIVSGYGDRRSGNGTCPNSRLHDLPEWEELQNGRSAHARAFVFSQVGSIEKGSA